ncbi:MAG: DUF692 family multinuclear iron-containing protein [Aggregatilineales bacterium]
MLFAINYSLPAADLLRAGVIEIDRFKCPNWPDLIAEASALRPVYVHFDLIAGDDRLADVDWGSIERALIETETPFVNLHLAPTLNAFAEFTAEPLSAAQEERVIEKMAAELEQVIARFGADRVLVENIPYRGKHWKKEGRRFLATAVKPKIFSQLIRELGVGFLFDISHARIAASNLGWDEREYIAALPLERIREVHVTGLAMIDDFLTDHLAMREEDWQIFDWVIELMQAGTAAAPWLLAFEYGGVGPKFEWRTDPEAIAADAPRFYAAVQSVNLALPPAR